MFDNYLIVLICIGALAIAALSIYIYKQLRFIKSEKEKAQQNLLKLQQQQAEKYKYVTDSLKIIAQAIIEEQVDIVEGSIRVKALLDHYDASMNGVDDYSVFNTVFTETEHIPIKEAWKALDSKSKRKHQKHMDELAEKYTHDVKAAAKTLLEHFAQKKH